MAMVGVDSGSLYSRTHSLSRLAWSWVGGRLAPFYIHQNEPGELSQWLCHDDSTINIVLDIIIIIIIINRIIVWCDNVDYVITAVLFLYAIVFKFTINFTVIQRFIVNKVLHERLWKALNIKLVLFYMHLNYAAQYFE